MQSNAAVQPVYPQDLSLLEIQYMECAAPRRANGIVDWQPSPIGAHAPADGNCNLFAKQVVTALQSPPDKKAPSSVGAALARAKVEPRPLLHEILAPADTCDAVAVEAPSSPVAVFSSLAEFPAAPEVMLPQSVCGRFTQWAPKQ